MTLKSNNYLKMKNGVYLTIQKMKRKILKKYYLPNLIIFLILIKLVIGVPLSDELVKQSNNFYSESNILYQITIRALNLLKS